MDQPGKNMMDGVSFDLYSYPVRVGVYSGVALSFDQGDGRKRVGTITAPPGTEIHRHAGKRLAKLKVPRTQGNTLDKVLLTAADALDEAQQGNLGLAYESAAPGEDAGRG